MKLTWCHNRLAIGSEDGCGVEALEEAGVTHLVNCRRAPVRFAGTSSYAAWLAVLWNPAEDDGRPKPAEWFARSIEFALGALAGPQYRVCVCCCHGNNRAPSTALAILMAQGLAFDEAFGLVRLARPDAEARYAQDALAAVKVLGYA